MATAVKQHKLFIGGEWVESTGDGSLAVTSPSTGEPMAEVSNATAEDVNRAVEAAKKAFTDVWFDTTPKERMEALLKLADAIDEHAEELGRIESENVGKVFSLTMSEELPVIADNIRFFAAGARFLEGRAAGEYMKGYTSIVRRTYI